VTVNRGVLLQRGSSTLILWAAVLYLIFSGSKAGSMLLVAASGLMAQWEFYHLQEEKKLRVFKKWGVVCGLVLYLACWYLFIQAPQHAAMIDGVEQVLFVALTTGVLASVLLAKFKPFGGLPGLTLLDAVWLGILLSLASVVGDLAESVVKRDAHIKDSGHFIPGIGGALDLIDSLLFTAPVFYFYVRFVLGL